MDADTLAAITALAGAVKPTLEAIRAALSRAKGREAENAAQEALALVADLQARILPLQEVAFRLHREKAEAIEENAKLREQLREKEEWTAERKKYRRKKTLYGTAVIRDDEPGIYFCPACLESRHHAIPLQNEPAPGGNHRCPGCKALFTLTVE